MPFRIDDERLDWICPPADARWSELPGLLQHGHARAATDLDAGVFELRFSLPHVERFGLVPAGTTFVARVRDVSSARVSKQVKPDATATADTRADPVEVSMAWELFERATAEGGLLLADGAMIEDARGVAVQWVGSFPAQGDWRARLWSGSSSLAPVWSGSDPTRHPGAARTWRI